MNPYRKILSITSGALALILAGCASVPTHTEPRLARPAWTQMQIGICLPEVFVGDATTGQEIIITNGPLGAEQLSQKLQQHLQGLGAKTVLLKEARSSPAAFDRAGSLEQWLASQPVAAVALQSSQATHLLLFSLRTKIGPTVALLETTAQQIVPFPLKPFQARSPNAALISAALVDLKQNQAVWRNQLFQRINSFEERDLNPFIETLLTSTKP